MLEYDEMNKEDVSYHSYKSNIINMLDIKLSSFFYDIEKIGEDNFLRGEYTKPNKWLEKSSYEERKEILFHHP